MDMSSVLSVGAAPSPNFHRGPRPPVRALISEGDDITTAERLEPAGLRTIRRLMLLLLLVAMIGTATDLMLLDHHEDFWQMVPLGVIALGVASAAAAAR